MRKYFVVIFILAALGAACQRPKEKAAAPEAPSAPFAAFVDEYFIALFDWSPTSGTAQGFHQYDTKLDDLSAAAYAKRIETLKTELSRLQSLRSGGLSGNDSIDAEVLEG